MYSEIRKIIKRHIGVVWFLGFIIMICIVIFFIRKEYVSWMKRDTNVDAANRELSEAAKIGKMATHKLLIQIENINCSPEIAKGCYERGDIVMIALGSRDFSDAEKAGFLILKMNLTDRQAELLVRAEEREKGEKDMNGNPSMEQVKMRRYSVDLAKIGLGPEIQRGRIMDQVYDWSVISTKN